MNQYTGKSTCIVCGEMIRLHSYKGWYHPDGKGKGKRDHSPKPKKVAPQK